jgi:HK97 family phage major capsid protein
MFADPQFGHLRFSKEEVEAVRAVEEARTAMLTSSTGFPLPFALDPSILLNSAGALNPIRTVARQITVTAPVWKGVSSTGVSASYDPEGNEVSDDTPALVQPTITAATGRAFVQASMESFEDWPGLRQELATLIADARDVLDATQFLTGSGTASPGGILNIGGIGGLTTAQRVQTAGSATLAVADIYSLVEALPPRFQPRGVIATSQTIGDKIYRLTPSGSTTEPQLMPTRDGGILGRRLIEWSTMTTATTTGSKVAIFGDWSGFVVLDRLGLTAEFVPTVVGSNHLPLGVRGIFCHWRGSCGVVTPTSFKYLEVL